MSTLNPYLNFRDTTSEVMDFYRSVFGGELTKSTFGDFHASEDPAEVDKIMHAQLTTPSGFTLMAADTPGHMEYPEGPANISVSLSGGPDEEAELSGYYEKLAEGGTVVMPLGKAPWGDTFGMCVDKYGTSWLVNILGAPA